MNLKYGQIGIALPKTLDTEFQLKYHPKQWTLQTIKQTVFTDEKFKSSLIARLEYKNYDQDILHDIIQQEAWVIFVLNFTGKFGCPGPDAWRDEDFKDRLRYAVAEFINRTMQETKISYAQHKKAIKTLTEKIEALENLFNKLLKGNFLTHSLIVEDKISAWVKENAIAMDEWETVALEKLSAYIKGFNNLFNSLINQWYEANQIKRNHSDFDQEINDLYDRLKTKYQLNIMVEISETRQNIAQHWQKLRTVIKTITPKKAVVTFIGG